MDIRLLGHSCFTLSDGGTTLLIDPFLTGNPKAAATADEVEATTILLTHGHQDHFGDTIEIVYHLGDTCVFSDLALVGKHHPIDVALMCIGGHYTMDRHDAVDAAELVGAKTVIPCHYDTMPAIETDAEAFKNDVETSTGSSVVVLTPGETHTA